MSEPVAEGRPTVAAPAPSSRHATGGYLALLSLGALGIVYGDIGTSPLYAMKQAFYGPLAAPLTHQNVLGVLSLTFWALIIIVTIKYHVVIIKADNNGEGGVLALMTLVQRSRTLRGLSPSRIMLVLGVFGTALMYADGALTPAISVMSAVEGLQVATPALERYVLPIVLVILVTLFLMQRHGTGKIGTVFGPIMLLWFWTIGVLGLLEVIKQPSVLAAISPWHAVDFMANNIGRGFVVLGAVFLVVTGGEALYADLGHFGHNAIQVAWFTTALPCLLLNYFGQGALLLRDPAAAENPFYHLAPSWFLYPLIALATAATIIASQAVISGAFSNTRQAMQLGYSPRLKIEHTSSREIGQIYVPAVNFALMVLTILLVLFFRNSTNIAGAYGVALSTLMVMTTVMFGVMAREVWHWSLTRVMVVEGLFLIVDLSFFVANALKIPHGGWVPLAIAAVIYLFETTWKTGRQILGARLSEIAVPLHILLGDIMAEPPVRVAGTAVFMTAQPDGVPYTLIYNLRHNHVLHERNVFLTMATTGVPRVAPESRVEVTAVAEEFYRVNARYGFMEEPDVREVIDACRKKDLDIAIEATSFFLGRETLLASERPGMAKWREHLFALMARNTSRATTAFNVPTEQVIEIGAQIEL